MHQKIAETQTRVSQLDLLEIIHDLAEINQQLDWESPVDQELRFRVIQTIEKLERKFEEVEAAPSYSTLASAAARVFILERQAPCEVAPIFQPIRRKHLTLVWSRK